MPTLTIADAKKNFSAILKNVAEDHRGYYITSRQHQAVLLSVEDWNAIQESLYLNAIPGMADSIVKGMETPVEQCSTELKW